MSDEEEDPRRRYSDDDFVGVLREQGPAVTSEVAEHVGCSRRQAYNRLKELEREGELNNREVGNTLLWMLAE